MPGEGERWTDELTNVAAPTVDAYERLRSRLEAAESAHREALARFAAGYEKHGDRIDELESELRKTANALLKCAQERGAAESERDQWEREYRDHLAVCDTAEYEGALAVKAKLEATESDVEAVKEALVLSHKARKRAESALTEALDAGDKLRFQLSWLLSRGEILGDCMDAPVVFKDVEATFHHAMETVIREYDEVKARSQIEGSNEQ